MMSRDGSQRVYPNIGLTEPHHAMSHHGKDPQKLANLVKLNTYHIQLFGKFLERLRSTPNGSLLDHSYILFGSGMGEADVHSRIDVPTLVMGGGGGLLKGNRLVTAKAETPLANFMLDIANEFGIEMDRFGERRATSELHTSSAQPPATMPRQHERLWRGEPIGTFNRRRSTTRCSNGRSTAWSRRRCLVVAGRRSCSRRGRTHSRPRRCSSRPALVQVVGCVGGGTGAAWRLTSASDPVVVGNPALTTEEVQAARGRALGNGTFTLVSVDRFNPGSHEGQKVAARGLVYRGPNRNLLTVISLQTVEPRCGN